MADRIVLVTGCGSGIGLLTAVSAARAGMVVYAGLRNLGTGASLAEAARGLDVRPVQLDVTRADQRQAAVAQILDAHGRIDGLVNNAGRPLGGFLETLSEAEVRALFDVNFFAVFSLTNLVLPAMRAQQGGCVINVSSVAGRMAMPGLSAYAASKFAVEGMTEGLARELRPFGVRVALVEPGPYKTDIFGRNKVLGERATDEGPYSAMARRMEATAERVIARAGDPQDVADRIVALLLGSARGLRHPLGASAHIRLAAKAVLPSWVIEAAIGRVVGKP